MPKVTLTFTLPEEESEYTCAREGSNYYAALHDLYFMFRSERKYGADRWTEVEEKFWEILRAREIEV